MAAVTTSKLQNVTIAGMEFTVRGRAKVALTRGMLLDQDASGYFPLAAAGTHAKGIALTNTPIGEVVDVGKQGEMDGYSGLTPGATLYPSGAVAGGINTTVVGGATIQVRAMTTSRIYFNFV